MGKFINDFAGAVYDSFKFLFKSSCYLLAGMFIVGVPLYLVALIFSMFH